MVVRHYKRHFLLIFLYLYMSFNKELFLKQTKQSLEQLKQTHDSQKFSNRMEPYMRKMNQMIENIYETFDYYEKIPTHKEHQVRMAIENHITQLARDVAKILMDKKKSASRSPRKSRSPKRSRSPKKSQSQKGGRRKY